MNSSSSFRTTLRQTLKYFGIAVAVIFMVFAAVSWFVVENKNDWLLEQIHSVMQESQSGQLEITSTNFKIFRSFPDITIELGGIDYYEHHDTLRLPGEQSILHAEQLFVAIELLPLINDELKISEVSLSNAQLRVTEYQNGELNINRALASRVKPKVVRKKVVPQTTSPAPPPQKKKTTPAPPVRPKPKAAIQVDLQNVALSNLHVTWNAYNSPDTSAMLIEDLEIELERDEAIVNVQLTSAHTIESLFINGSSIPPRKLVFNAAVDYDINNQQLTIRDSEINYDIFSLTLQGAYAHRKNQLLDLQVDASSNDLKLLSKIVKQEVLKHNPDLLKKGDIYLAGRIFGELKNQPPQFDISFGVRGLALILPKNRGTFRNIGFDGRFTSGKQRNYSQASFEIKNLRGELPGGFLQGEFSLHNFAAPYLKYELHSKLKLDGYDDIFQINSLKALSGTISLEANYDGPLKYFAQHQTDSSRSSAVTLENMSFVLVRTNQKISGLSGKIENRDNRVTIQQLAFTYGKNDMLINATVDNLVYFLFKRERKILASGNIQSNQLFTQDFLFDTISTAAIQDRISNLSVDFDLQTTSKIVGSKTVIADLNFDIKALSAQLDKLPNLKMVTAKGTFRKADSGLQLDLQEFHATMPQGKLAVSGDLHIPKKRLLEFNAKVKANKFPWTYVKELAAEIRSDQEPVAKNLPVKEMDILTADLDVSASITTYPFDLNRLAIRNSQVNFSFSGSKTLSAEKLDLALENLRFIHPDNSGALIGLKSTKGTIQLKQLHVPGLNKIDVNMHVNGENDTLDIDFSSATQKAKSEKGKLFMDISKKEIVYQLTYHVKGADLESFIQKFYKKKFMKGVIDYQLSLSTTGSSLALAKQNMNGTIEITGDSLHLSGVDIDNVLKKFERSQNFNLTDVGAVVLAGPLGLAVTKGTDFVSLATVNLNPKHHTTIQTLQAKWKLENRQLITEDVAFSTQQNRIAFNGKIDFARDSIPGLTVAVVDKNGCSLMDQKLYGKTTALKTGKLNITKTLFGSVINFVNAIVGKDCKPVYTGKVRAPNQ